jgi:hypothetical protein
MGVLVMVESCILALTTGTALAQGLSAPPMWVRPLGVQACPSPPGAQATWLSGAAAVGRVQPFAFTRVGLRPFGYMDNGRWHDERGEGMWNNEELRERYRNYGYDYPPSAYAYPRFGPYYHDPDTGHYYNFSRGHYYNPSTGRHQYVYPGPGYYGPNNGR